MKKMLFILLLPSLLLIGCTKSGLSNEEKLKGSWRLQNPKNLATNLVIEINDSMVYKTVGSEIDTLPTKLDNGIYEVKGNILKLSFFPKSNCYKIGWQKNGDLTLTDGNKTMIFSKTDGPNDRMIKNYNDFKEGRYQKSPQIHSNQSRSERNANSASSDNRRAVPNSNPF